MKIDRSKLILSFAKSCLSMREISELSGVGAVTLTRISRGTQEPIPRTVGKIARALNVTVEELIQD